MTSFSTITFCLFYLLVGIIASALLRTAAVPFAIKIIVPALIVALACVTYKTLPDMFGYPVDTDFASLPLRAELIAFHPYDDEKMVDLWLMPDGVSHPRAYSIEMTESLKDTLRKAKKAKADGERTMLAKKAKPNGKKRPHQYSDIDGGEAPYTLLPNAFQLPQKDTQQ